VVPSKLVRERERERWTYRERERIERGRKRPEVNTDGGPVWLLVPSLAGSQTSWSVPVSPSLSLETHQQDFTCTGSCQKQDPLGI